ncbi:MAG TPA: hypothetical protein DCP08_04315 [Chloroflexi bacterium]|nr:hypothetical protein [Chloroflexota bacterium]
MTNYLPLATILVLSALVGLRRGARSQLLLTAVIAGGWLALAPGGSPLAAEVETKLEKMAGGSIISAGAKEGYSTFLLLVIILLTYFLLWRLGSRPESIRGALIGTLWGLANGFLIALTLLPSALLPSLLTPITVGERAVEAMKPGTMAPGKFDLHPIIIGGVFILIILAVRAIRPHRPDLGNLFKE